MLSEGEYTGQPFSSLSDLKNKRYLHISEYTKILTRMQREP